MKYLNLSEEESRNLKILSRKKFLSAYLTSLIGLIIISYLLHVLVKEVLFLSLTQIILLAVIAMVCMSILWIFKNNILLGINHDKKKIYTGVIANKKIKDSRHYIYMDGNKYRVSENDYNSFNVGDSIEFHVSVKHKYLLKVGKPH